MKKSKLFLFFLLPLAVLLLSGCSSNITGSSWPGVNATEDTVFVSYMTNVYAVNAANGSMIWQYPEKAGRTMFFAAPTISGDQVIVGDYSNVLHSLNAKTGAEIWTFTQATNDWVASPIVVGDTILAPNSDKFLYALDLNGKLKWKFETERAIWSQPVSDGETVFLASMDHNLYAIDLANGTQKWLLSVGGAVPYGLTLDNDGILYMTTLAHNLMAVDSTTGKVLWEKKYTATLWTHPLLSEGVLYFGDMDGNIYANSAKDGSQLWTLAVGEAITGQPTLVDENVIFSTETGSLIAVNLQGQREWTLTFEGPLYNGPVKVGDQLALGINNKDTFLRMLNASGQGVWTFVAPK